MLIGLLSLRLQTSSASKISSAGKSPHELLNLYCFILSASYAWYLKLLPVVNRFTSTKVCYQQIGASLGFSSWRLFLPSGTACYSSGHACDVPCCTFSCCCGPCRLHSGVGLSLLGSFPRTAPHAFIGFFLAGWWCLVQSCLQTTLISPSWKRNGPLRNTQY